MGESKLSVNKMNKLQKTESEKTYKKVEFKTVVLNFN
ncbi:hypothetical protein NIES2100_24660 [Calothrix sp. NIES-2100]|nr:hypothetical protein NIES2100_24660 [Calothrix sp. NIES-2100]